MISFLQLPCRTAHSAPSRANLGPLATVLILALILFFQLGLLVWVFL